MEDMLTPPKAENKFPLVNFQELVYPRIKHPVLEAKQKDCCFLLCITSTETEADFSSKAELLIPSVQIKLARMKASFKI